MRYATLRCKKKHLSKILNWISQILLSDPFLESSFLLILQGPEAVAAALAGCKILKEMARLESEAESARSMKEAKYEQFALGEYTNHSMMTTDSVIGKKVKVKHSKRFTPWPQQHNRTAHKHEHTPLKGNNEYESECVNPSTAAKRLTLSAYCSYCGRCLWRVLLQQWRQGLCFVSEENTLLEQIYGP